MDKFVIKQALESDIKSICDILKEAANWCKDSGMAIWRDEELDWDMLSKLYRYDEFYLGYLNDEAVAVMALQEYDKVYWPLIPKGESLILHKLAVKRSAAGKGISLKMIDFAKERTKSLGIKTLRLDTLKDRVKLREIYEREGFELVKEIIMNDMEFSLYKYEL